MATVAELIGQISYEIGDDTIEEHPPLLYLNGLNRAIDLILQFLISNQIDYKIDKETITTVNEVEQYAKKGKVKLLLLNNIPLILKDYFFRQNFWSTGYPQFYYETLDKIGLIPVPNGVWNIEHSYIPYPTRLVLDTDIFPYPVTFERIAIVEAVMQLIHNVPNLPAWKVEKWMIEREQQYQMIRQIYKEPMKNIWEGRD